MLAACCESSGSPAAQHPENERGVGRAGFLCAQLQIRFTGWFGLSHEKTSQSSVLSEGFCL